MNIRTVLVLFVVLGVAYSLATPIFEKPDEMWHLAYIKRLVNGQGYPDAPRSISDDAPSQESSQPPMYYTLAALVVRTFAPDTSDLHTRLTHNPAFPFEAREAQNDNKNVFVHAVVDVFPFEGTARAVQLARLVALCFGALTVCRHVSVGAGNLSRSASGSFTGGGVRRVSAAVHFHQQRGQQRQHGRRLVHGGLVDNRARDAAGFLGAACDRVRPGFGTGRVEQSQRVGLVADCVAGGGRVSHRSAAEVPRTRRLGVSRFVDRIGVDGPVVHCDRCGCSAMRWEHQRIWRCRGRARNCCRSASR